MTDDARTRLTATTRVGPARPLVTVIVLAIGWSAADSRAIAQGLLKERLQELPAFVESTMPKLLEQAHVPGAAVVVIHDGAVLVQRAYGQADVESGRPVDAARTLFRIGSVTKLFTAIAAMQLVDAGKLDLHRDVRAYLPELAIPHGATMHQLLTHTAGFDERFAGAYTDSPAHLVSLADHLRIVPPAQFTIPGTSYSYSNYHYAVAGLVIERISGQLYDIYVEDRILVPLKMTVATARQPPQPGILDRARGYRWDGDRQEPLPFRLTYAAPSGGISASAGDMGKLMLALLGDGGPRDQSILSSEAVRTLLGPRYTPHPRVPAQAYGALHWETRGQNFVYRDGTLGDQAAAVVLAPAHKLGIFAAWNSPSGIGLIVESIVTFLFGPEVTPPAPNPTPDASTRTLFLAGTYRDLHRTRNDRSSILAIFPMMQSRVRAEADGSIRWQGRRWIEVEPFVFRSANSADHIVFRTDAQGRGASVHTWQTTHERIGWWEQIWFQAGVLAFCVLSFGAYAAQCAVHALRHRRSDQQERLARRLGLIVAIFNLMFIAGVAALFRQLGASVPLPAHQVALLSCHYSASGSRWHYRSSCGQHGERAGGRGQRGWDTRFTSACALRSLRS